MFDHVELKVADVSRSVKFYEAALAPLGIKLLFNGGDVAGFGTENIRGADGKVRTEFLIEAHSEPTKPIHLAFCAPDTAAVDQFHAQGLAAGGGRDNGAPGLRADYHAKYYAAFLIDPDGHNVEAVLHT